MRLALLVALLAVTHAVAAAPPTGGRVHTCEPVHVGALRLPDLATDVAVEGDLLCVVTRFGGLHTVDVSDPASPVHLAMVRLPEAAWSVSLSDGIAYVAAGNAGLQIVDVTTPTSPARIGSAGAGYTARDVSVSRVEADGVPMWGSRKRALTDSGTSRDDVPRSWSLVREITGSAESDAITTDSFKPKRRMRGTLAVVADDEAGLRVFDVSDPSDPVLLAAHATGDRATGVALDGHFALVADAHLGLTVVDLAVPSAPITLGARDGPGAARKVGVWQDLAVVASDGAGVIVHDVADPSLPVPLAAVPTRRARDVCVGWGLACVADAGGLRVIDLDGPGLAHEIGAIRTPSAAMGVAISGSTVFVADLRAGLQVYDVSDCHAARCYADMDGNGIVNVLDLIAYQMAWLAGEQRADCNEDGVLAIDDFVCFQTAFVAGCD